jgi:hypothetical protein
MVPGSEPLQLSDSGGDNDSKRVDAGLLSNQSSEKIGVVSSILPLDLSAIKGPAGEQSDQPDKFTIKQLLHFTPKERIEYEHIKLIERFEEDLRTVRRERDSHKSECTAHLGQIDLWREKHHIGELEHAVLKTTRKGGRWKDAGVAVASLVAGALISSFPRGNGWFAFGWALLGLSSVYQVARSGLNTP